MVLHKSANIDHVLINKCCPVLSNSIRIVYRLLDNMTLLIENFAIHSSLAYHTLQITLDTIIILNNSPSCSLHNARDVSIIRRQKLLSRWPFNDKLFCRNRHVLTHANSFILLNLTEQSDRARGFRYIGYVWMLPLVY